MEWEVSNECAFLSILGMMLIRWPTCSDWGGTSVRADSRQARACARTAASCALGPWCSEIVKCTESKVYSRDLAWGIVDS